MNHGHLYEAGSLDVASLPLAYCPSTDTKAPLVDSLDKLTGYSYNATLYYRGSMAFAMPNWEYSYRMDSWFFIKDPVIFADRINVDALGDHITSQPAHYGEGINIGSIDGCAKWLPLDLLISNHWSTWGVSAISNGQYHAAFWLNNKRLLELNGEN
ncbi:MAG: hypothetical protein HQL31_10090 [Planctomycetes bacterium]|nr:hypothetical protein [Planctomycetota bacterium]